MTKQCTQCSKTFKVEEWDKNFYTSFDVPEPTHCPECRFRRRLVWRNSRNLYKRNCDLCHEEFIGVYSPDKPYTVYCQSCYYSDKWSPLDFGQDIDVSRPFFEQFDELMKRVPHVGTNNQECEGSEYVNVCWKTTNSYMCFGSDMCDACFYCTSVYNSRSSYNSYVSSDLELSSYCVDCKNCYNTHYSQECENIRDSYFCFDIKNSNNCFGSAGLRNVEYYIFNKPVDKDVWQEKVDALLKQYSTDELYAQAEVAWTTVPRKSASIKQSDDVKGDHIENSSQAMHCFDCKEVNNVKYVTHSVPYTRDSMDADNTGAEAELMYEFIIGYGYNLLCSSTCYGGVSNLSYCYEVQSSKDCFGSIGLRKQQYVILNKQYRKDEYLEIVEKLKQHMKGTGEWGEFFPITLSPFAYNETEAQVRFPITEIDAKSQGVHWHNRESKPHNGELPTCKECGQNYRIIQQELDFLSQQHLPMPDRCPECRFQLLFTRRNPYTLWQRQCMCTQPGHNHGAKQCPTEFETTYSPDRKELVYCEMCYNKEVL